jgi:hypothetical protein
MWVLTKEILWVPMTFLRFFFVLYSGWYFMDFKRWVHLSNGYWLKIMLFRPSRNMWSYKPNIYLVDIVVAKTKRQVNDHYNSTRKSPKSLGFKSTNNRGGLESLTKTLEVLKECESILPKGSILRIEGSDERRRKVYGRLVRYGFVTASWYAPNWRWHKEQYYFKEI